MKTLKNKISHENIWLEGCFIPFFKNGPFSGDIRERHFSGESVTTPPLRQLPWDHVPSQLCPADAAELILTHIEKGGGTPPEGPWEAGGSWGAFLVGVGFGMGRSVETCGMIVVCMDLTLLVS